MGIYKEIFKRLTGNKERRKTKPKRKAMQGKKPTPEQKAKRRKILDNIKKRIISGDVENAVITGTRYAQGKPIVLKKNIKPEDKKLIPDTVNILGVPVKTPVLIIGSLALLAGTIYAVKKINK